MSNSPILNTFQPKSPKIIERPFSETIYQEALQLGLTELQAKLIANRINDGDFTTENLSETLKKLIYPRLTHLQHPDDLKNSLQAAELIADAISSNGKIVLATDYDTDGVTSAWVATRSLIDYFQVDPSRLVHIISERKDGYGINEEVVNRVLAIPDEIAIVISADQGSSDEPRIQKLTEAGIQVCVTDHHQIAPEGPPASAACTVNPQQEGCDYDKTVAGCFVIFLVMGQTRKVLIERNQIPESTPSLKELAINVALGTVADSVSLKSINNRAIVQAGLGQVNQLQQPAWQAMHALNDNQGQPIDSDYLGFQVATRINAASRVSDVNSAFNFLNANSFDEAQTYLDQLDQDNQNRKFQQEEMLQAALSTAKSLYHPEKYSLAVPMQGNAGIQGIIATRIGELFGVPTIAMTDLQNNTMAGSARGIVACVDLKAAFEWMSEQQNDLFISRGGHKGAAGCMIPKAQFDNFSELFEQAIMQQLGSEVPVPLIETDGELHSWQLTPQLIQELRLLEPYGREWPRPLFSGKFFIEYQKPVGQTQTHLSLKLKTADHQKVNAIYFNAKETAQKPDPVCEGDEIFCTFHPSLNTFYGKTTLQLRLTSAQRI